MKCLGRLSVLLAAVLAMALLPIGCEDNNNDGRDNSGIVGTWNVVSNWRWSQVTFRSDGGVDCVQRSDGASYPNSATWDVSGGQFTLTSDVSETCNYTLAGNNLTIFFSNNTVIMVKA